MQKAADTHQLVQLEGNAPVEAVFHLGGGDVGGLCDAVDVRTGLAQCEVDSPCDADFG